jgi:UDP-N-acetylmuramyl pentapeptide phosphotransferase/UDP-N-acetylglucosamine-1-phosphate transferase
MYGRRNEVERLFRKLKGYRRIFSRFEKLDVMFIAFTSFALIAERATRSKTDALLGLAAFVFMYLLIAFAYVSVARYERHAKVQNAV